MGFDELKVGDRVKTKYSGWATVISLEKTIEHVLDNYNK